VLPSPGKGCLVLVYGDVKCVESVGSKRDAIDATLRQAARLGPGVEHHAALVTAFIAASELVQAVADIEFERRGFDARSEVHDIGMGFLVGLARRIDESWRSGFGQGRLPFTLQDGLSKLEPSLSISWKHAEGYAYYAVYPESYLEAAARSGLGPRTQVIGIRSIGTGLSAMVAAALDAPLPITVRPIGHPFRREVRIDPALAEELATCQETTIAIVDEGPGLSGSSFGAVADWLEANGVSRDRIHFFPSHGGDLGSQANQDHRKRWNEATRHIVSMDELLLRSSTPSQNLTTWVKELLGPLEHPLEDISGGAWRGRCFSSEEGWPAASIHQERRKFLARSGGTLWLIKFAGLGDIGELKLQRARVLHQAGFTPEVIGYRHGFLVERWYDNARPLDPMAFDRRRVIDQIGAYLAFRTRHFPAARDRGASLNELLQMARHNTQQALGRSAAAVLEHSMMLRPEVEKSVRRIDTDNRMHIWEWLVLDDRLIKTDALDHSSAHDLIGCQDITWDIAGAMVEFNLTRDEVDYLCKTIERDSGHGVDPVLLAFLHPCYLAFQLGSYTMAADALGEGPEFDRLRLVADRYATMLKSRTGR
jgi:hypothetical protein